MAIMCVYQDCLSVKYPCSKTAFFRLPADERRFTWIKNSGNKSLLNIGEKATRFFCEKHFRECDINSQFNRKLLRRHSVPIKHASLLSSSETNEPQEESNESNEGNMVTQENINVYIEAIDENNINSSVYHESPVLELNTLTETRENLEDSVDVPYSLMELYDEALYENIPEEKEDVPTEKQNKLDDETLEIYFEDTSSNQVDSSTIEPEPSDTHFFNETEIGNPAKKKRPNETETNSPPQRDKPVVTNTVSENSYEEDKHFALSLVGYFQRLPQGLKSMAKLKILQYLTELEIDLPPCL